MSPNVPASVKARLLNRARSQGEELERFLIRFANERFLYRLGRSKRRGQCILKGAGLLTLWMPDPYRMTRDLDFLAYGPDDAQAIRELIEEVCAVPCTEDGMTFDLSSLEISPIRPDEEYHGQRALFFGYLGTARIRMQIDFGFGDALPQGPEDSEYPTMLEGLPAPNVRVYPRVVSVAEKLEAMVQLGLQNSRMKDFHDVWALSLAFPFDGKLLRDAAAACLERRKTDLSAERPVALTTTFYAVETLQRRWQAYLEKGSFHAPPPLSFEAVGQQVVAFLGPVVESIAVGEVFVRRWEKGGPWVEENAK